MWFWFVVSHQKISSNAHFHSTLCGVFFFSKRHFSRAGQKQGARLDEHFSLESLTSAFNNGTQTR